MVKKHLSCYGVMKANHKRLIKAAESQYGPFENTLEGCFYSWKMKNNTPQINIYTNSVLCPAHMTMDSG